MKYVLLIGFIVIAIFSIRNQFKPVEKNVPATDVIQNPSLVAEKPATDVIQNPSQVVEKPAMVLITEGELYMGDTFGDGEGDEKPSRLSLKIDSYYIGAYEVTFREFDAFCEASDLINKPDDAGWRRGSRPVINVSWLDAIKYCNWLSEQHGYQKVYTISGSTVTANWNANGYRLPTEAEWEFAARERGKKVRFGNGKDIAIPEEINFDGSHQKKESYSKGGAYREKTTEVGYFAPNDLGLYDMSGNVWEWCWDWYGNYLDFPQDNLHGPENGTVRIVRGGSWENGPKDARCTNRGYEKQTQRFETVGFRLARATERF